MNENNENNNNKENKKFSGKELNIKRVFYYIFYIVVIASRVVNIIKKFFDKKGD